MGVTELALNHTETAATTLADRWRQLASIIEEASKIKDEVSNDPSLANDVWVVAHVRWLTIFERELAAVQKVYEAVEAGKKLPTEDIRAAADTAEKLLEVVTEARSRFREPQPA